MARHLTPQQIDHVIKTLLASDGEYVARGRSGSGYASRDGKLFTIYVEDDQHEEHPITEAKLRAELAKIDLDDSIHRYEAQVLKELGVD